MNRPGENYQETHKKPKNKQEIFLHLLPIVGLALFFLGFTEFTKDVLLQLIGRFSMYLLQILAVVLTVFLILILCRDIKGLFFTKNEDNHFLGEIDQVVFDIGQELINFWTPCLFLVALLLNKPAVLISYFTQLGSIFKNLSLIPLGVLTLVIIYDVIKSLRYFMKWFNRNWLDINVQTDLPETSLLDDVKKETKNLLDDNDC